MLRTGRSIEFRPHRICFIKYIKIYISGNSGNLTFGAVLPAYTYRRAQRFYQSSPVVIGISCQPVIIGKTFGVQYMIVPVSVAVDAKKISAVKNNAAEGFYNFGDGSGTKSALTGPFQIIKNRKIKRPPCQYLQDFFCFFPGLEFVQGIAVFVDANPYAVIAQTFIIFFKRRICFIFFR